MRLASAVFRRLHSDLVNIQFRSLRMVDPSGKGSGSGSGSGSEAEEANPNGASSGKSPTKTCADCGTTKTPLWRGGPAGPKSLCNACGIRSRKKKRAILGVSKGGSNDESKRGKRSSGTSNNSSSNKLGDSYSLKQRLLALGREVLMQRSSVRKKLGEEEQAAVVLMSLSYAESVYA